jgi:hypothetical protein
VPDEYETDRGGGYFIWHRGQGIVIDPGYDFVENFHRAGGRVDDIHHVVITHAHPDHTADFETLLNLFYEYNHTRKEEKSTLKKRVRLYLNVGADRKFAGLYSLRSAEYIDEVIVLNRGDREMPQRVRMFDGATLTVLRAYHDDVITSDNCVGLGFELTGPGLTWSRRILFTGDTSLYPKIPVPPAPSPAIYEQYPPPFGCPGPTPARIDLVVPHLGSVMDYELDPVPRHEQAETEETSTESSEGDAQRPSASGRSGPPKLFCPNHLGLHGTVILLDKLAPVAAIVSEFGEELKDFKIDLVRTMDMALQDKREKEKQPSIFVVPGDLSIVYDISSGKFLCHETCAFEPPFTTKGGRRLRIEESYDPNWKRSAEVKRSEKAPIRPYLFRIRRPKDIKHAEDALKTYYDKLRTYQLCYFKLPTSAGQ